MKPFAESCEQNKQVILDVIKRQFSECKNILEIGSGTGQHAVFFAAHLRHLHWQPSERSENLAGIQAWLQKYPQKNISQPIELDVTTNWPDRTFDGVFSANTAHIMSWPEVIRFFEGISHVLQGNGLFCLYGPFNYNQQYSSESNRRFDSWLKEQDPARGIRDFADLDRLAKKNGLAFKEDTKMPANNRILIWQKKL